MQMKNYLKIGSVVMALGLAVSVGACERKDAPKVIKTEKVQAKPMEAVNLYSLDLRVTALEKRNSEIDKAVRAKRAQAAKAAVVK